MEDVPVWLAVWLALAVCEELGVPVWVDVGELVGVDVIDGR